MKRLLILVVGIALATFGFQAPAQAWGTQDRCDYYNSHTNGWAFFIGHNVSVYGRMCVDSGSSTRVPNIPWTRTPEVTFPSSSPLGATETVKMAKAPFFVTAIYESGQVVKVRYKFSVEHCAISSSLPLCSTYDFSFTYGLFGTRICSWGGACDDWKQW